ncbi:gliding motility-associated C-terminal domain-containing protein [Flavobacterium piscisymbiosum]|uniref:DUF11 domain-containing protein n=1 Tax=Flavobacterium piscisymbiosum TaxID=2893753 RepID=A0ABS8MHL3_9FLAO|nr:gliding motility-associated C-terminal domain-containing protein [Flavobacterium sp. F-30]MCC9064402.1 DUF11 domain-containing protein [Flavobacterium sp. F-30]
MKKNSTFYDLNFQKRLFGLLFLFLLCTNASSQTICRPTSQTNSQGGLLCLGLNVDSPANAYDSAGLTTFATLTNAVGIGCFVEETLTLNQTAKAGDQIAIYFGTGNGLLDVGLLSNASLQTKLSGADVGTRVALNSPLLNLNLLNGNTVAVAKYTLTGDTNQVQIQVGGLLSLLVSLRIYDVRLEFAQPIVTGGLTQTVCAGSTTTLTATPAAGTTLAWYSSASSTTALATGDTYTTPALSTATTYYIGISRAAGCEGNVRVPVVLNVSNPVAPAVNNTGLSICATGPTQQTTLSLLNPVPGTVYSWYSASSGGAALATGTTYSPTVPLGTTPFYVGASVGSCVSPTRTPVNVISTAVPALPTVLTQSVTIQSGQNATLNASVSEPGVQVNWYEAATGGTAVATNTTSFTTPILTATKTYHVEAQSPNGICASASRVPVTVTVQPAALGGCLEASSQVTAQTGICLLCGSTNPNNSVDGNPATSARLTIPAGVLTGTMQQTLQFNNPGKAGDIVDVELELPGGLADVNLLGAVTLATYNGATYNNDRVAITNPLITLQLLTGNRFRASVVAGANFDRVEIRLGGLATLLTSLDIYQATYRYKAPVITGDTTICSGTSTTLTAALAVGETVNWYSTASGGASLASTAAYTTPAISVPTTYYVQVTRNGCINSERNPVQILIDNPIAPVVNAVPVNLCSGETTTLTVQSPVAGTIYNWYDAASGGNLLFTGTSFVTPALNASVTYHVEAAIGSCVNPTRTPVPVNVNPRPAVPTFAGSDVLIQSGQTITLSVLNPVAGVRYNWYDAAIAGASVALNATSYTTPVLNANKTYYVEAVNIATDCASPTRGVINVIVIANASTCLQAGTATTSTGGVCVLCSVAAANDAVDGNINTYSQLSVPLGVAGYIQQELIFANPGQTGDIIDVDLEVPVGLLDISLLSNISLATYNGGAYNNDRIAVNNNLLNIQLLSGNKFKASFTAAAPFDRIEVRLGGVATALSNLYIYQAAYRFPNASITGAVDPICAGQQATLAASSTGTETFTWYDAPTLGNIVNVSPTAPLTTSTTYYLQSTRDDNNNNDCFNSLRQAVTVTVLPIPTDADVLITTPVQGTCAGAAVIAPASTIPGAQFRYYTDQNKTTEIINGSVIGGVTFAKDAGTGVLSLTGLNAAGTPYNYFVSILNGGTCENVNGTLKQVTVNFPSTTTLALNATLTGCGSANLRSAITNFDSSGNTTYTFYDASNNQITADAASNITASGVYSVEAQLNSDTCPSVRQSVTVTINALPSLVITNPQESVNVGTSVTLTAVSTAAITWFDPQGNPLTGPTFTTGPLNTPGVYTYTAVANDGICTSTATKVINVINLSSCQSLTERVYATAQTFDRIITGTVTDGANAVDGNPQTFSTITTGLGLLGIGTTWQNLTWPSVITKGTPVTIKLGSEYSLLAVGQNLSVIGTLGGVDIGTMQSVSGSLLNLISGDNTYEFTFVPSDASGPQNYDGIRIQSASILSLAQNTKVFDAHYNRSVSSVACTPGDIRDIFYGSTDVGLPIGAVTAAVGVSDPWNIADNDITTFATMYSAIGVAAAADLTVEFKTPSVVTDTLRIVISKPGALLDVNLLTGFTIQRYLGSVAVGVPIQSNNTLLSLRLLPGNSMAMVLVSSPTESYDRVRIRFGGVAGVLDFLRVHTVERVANTSVVGADPQNKVTVCPGTAVTLQVPEQACSTYIWYDSPTGGTSVATGLTYTIPANLPAGIYKYYIQPVRYGCESFTRGEVTVEVRASAPVNALTDITLNGGTTTSICSPSGTVTLATSLSGTPVVTTPVYYWYNSSGATSQLILGETTSQLIVNGLAPGTYTYSVGVSSDQFCETSEADRKQITFTILPPSTVNDILVDDVTVCHDVPASLTPTAPTLTSPVFTWYLDAARTQPITNGAVIAGVTYAIDAAGVLTATGLTKAMSPITYYVAVASTNTCENLAGTLQDAVIMVSDPNTPTTTDDTQDFCLVTQPTVANIQVNESNVVWYSTDTGVTALLPTAALANGIYYGAVTDAVTGCESSVRLAVTVTVTDPGTPTTTDTTQDFCLVNTPTIASIQVDTPTVGTIVWYSASSGGTPLASTTPLTNTSYFAAILNATTTCESAVRLEVAVTVSDPGTPTTTDTTQDFCLVNTPTIANIQVDTPTVGTIVWYSASSGGTPLASTTPLTNSSYFAAILNATTTCESAVRLEVAVTVSDPGTPTTTDTTQDFCLVNAPTIASIQVDTPTVGTIVWYSASSGGTPLASTTPLTNTSYFAAILNATTTCESAVRLEVAVTVSDPGTPTTTDTTQDFCLVNAPTIASIQVDTPTVGTIVWYSASSGGTPLASTTPLTNTSYFAAILNATTTCESAVRLEVAVTVSDPGTPTTTDTTQDFCLVNTPTIANIQVDTPTVGTIVWYSASSGGTPLASTTPLTNSSYFAAILNATTTCESAVRLEVAVTVSDPGTPTTTDTTQDFCLVNTPTIANIQVDTPTVGTIVWYSASSGGTPLASTTPLTNTSYFAAILNATTTCESNVRLEVAVTVSDPGTPSIANTDQNFCFVDAPTVASINVSPAVAANIVWYDALSGGNSVASATALATGIYYAAIKDPTTGCESNIRLAVNVTVSDPGTPSIANTDQKFCLIDAPTVASINVSPAIAANIVWYDALSGGNSVASATALATGVYYAAIKDPTTGCESNIRLAINITVSDPGTPSIANTDQKFCLVDAPTVATINVSPAVAANIVWYDALSGGNLVASATALATGIYYAAIKDPVSGCESNVRLAVNVTVSDPGTPTLITAGTQNFCLVNAPTFASIQFNQPNIVWYTALTGGTAIASTTALTSGTYYAAIKDASGCESKTRLAVAVNVTDPATPTTTAVAQTFCSGNNPTVASIQVNETNVVWYNAVNGGAPIASTTALVSGDYFAALKDATTGCESSIRLKVTVTVGNSNNPTTNNTAQNFCSTSNPTFASIQVNENNVSWFTADTGGTAIPLATALTSGTYYGEITEPVTGCKSATRLMVTITIVNPMATPTTNSLTQNFCSVNAPKVSNIQVNESNVIWYSTPTGGTAIPATTNLVSGTYYGVIASGSGCENPQRLAVVVVINTPLLVTTPRTTQTFCLSAAPTIESIVVNETNIVWYTSANGGTPLAANTPLTATTYYAAALSNTTNGCEGVSRLGVAISFENDALVPITTTDDTPCVFQGITYSIANGKSDYLWTVENGTITSGGGNADGTVTISWSDIGPGKVSVAYINTCNERTIKSLNVNVATCSDLTITNTVSNPTPNFGEQITFTVTVNNVGEGNFINTIVSELLPSGFDLISASTTAGTYDLGTQLWTIPALNAGQSVVLTIVAEVLPSGNYTNVATVEISTPLDVDASNNSASVTVVPVCLTVYNEFTPNNDGANDLFKIDCIESYPNNELKVYNRYGSLVYSKQHYENDWDGTANVSGVINRGDMLPTGTYFYVITIGDGTVKKGWLSIMR